MATGYRFSGRVISGSITTPCPAAPMASLMLSWDQLLLPSLTITSLITTRFVNLSSFYFPMFCQPIKQYNYFSTHQNDDILITLDHQGLLLNFVCSVFDHSLLTGYTIGAQRLVHERQGYAGYHCLQPFRRGPDPENAKVRDTDIMLNDHFI